MKSVVILAIVVIFGIGIGFSINDVFAINIPGCTLSPITESQLMMLKSNAQSSTNPTEIASYQSRAANLIISDCSSLFQCSINLTQQEQQQIELYKQYEQSTDSSDTLIYQNMLAEKYRNACPQRIELNQIISQEFSSNPTSSSNQNNMNTNFRNTLECGPGTHEENEQCIPDNTFGGGCLIATATFGSELAPQVQQLRELRDNKLLQTESGVSFMNAFNEFYYSFSLYIADYERENPVFKEAVKIAITPLISSLSILNYVDMDSESEVLGYGISLILLNVGMYLGVPVMAIMIFRRQYT